MARPFGSFSLALFDGLTFRSCAHYVCGKCYGWSVADGKCFGRVLIPRVGVLCTGNGRQCWVAFNLARNKQ